MQSQDHRPTANRARVRLLVGLAMLALTACGGDADVAKLPVPQVKKPDAATPADPTAKFARAVAAKSSGLVDLRYDIAAKPLVNTPIDIELAFVPNEGADSMAVTFVPSEGLTLSAESAPNLEVVKVGTAHRVTVSAMASTPDVFYVTVTATMYTAGTSTARTFTIPLIVSDPAAAGEPADAAATKSPTKS